MLKMRLLWKFWFWRGLALKFGFLQKIMAVVKPLFKSKRIYA